MLILEFDNYNLAMSAQHIHINLISLNILGMHTLVAKKKNTENYVSVAKLIERKLIFVFINVFSIMKFNVKTILDL